MADDESIRDDASGAERRKISKKQLTDQNGTVHAFDRDLLGRPINDRVVTLGSGVDGTVQRIGRTYEVRGMLQNVTSYSSPTLGTGTVVNDVQRGYNSFEQCTAEYQEHNGAVNTSTSPMVGYQYADGSANTIRQTGLAYPDGRVLNCDYGISGGIDDALSRVASLIDNDGVTHLVDYTRIGVATFVQAASPQPQIAWSLINGAGIDPYTGLDQFDREVDNRWFSTATSTALDRIQHGYDRAGNRLWRKNTVAEAAGVFLDELYAYDGVYRLERLDRGQLNGTNTGIVAGTEDFTQAWGLDATGNWATFDQADTGGSWTLTQTRDSNTVNEITGISGGGWVVPAYDPAGNMITMPQPAAPTAGFSGIYDAWNRVVSLSAGASPVGAYLYDGFNRRVSKLVSSALRDIFYTTAWQAIEERVGGSTMPDRQFVRGLRYTDDLVVRDRGTERLYAMQDPNWNITAICDSLGEVQERYNFAAYGQPTFRSATFALMSASAFDWETLFGAYRFDAESGAYQVRERGLTPILGCWLSRDPMGFEDSVNPYAYVRQNPIRATDPTGMLTATDIAAGIVGFLRQFTPRGGARQCARCCTRSPIGCVCVIACFETELRHCCVPDVCCHLGKRKLCSVNRLQVTVGLYVCSSLSGTGWATPPFPLWVCKPSPVLKRPISGLGGIGNLTCPAEGLSGNLCVLASIGLSAWTYGARACYDFGTGNWTIDTGWGIGTGTGVAGGGGFTYTTCFLSGDCC